MKKIPFCFLLILLAASTNAQSVKIPAFTGYAVPAEKEEQTLFSESKGLTGWTDTRQSIHWFFKVRQTGELELSFHTKAHGQSGQDRGRAAHQLCDDRLGHGPLS